MTLPTVTEAQIRNRANEKSWARGRGYVDGVHDLVWRDGELTAQVEGSDWEPYRVRITFVGSEIAHATCSCPYDWGGDCKHIVAVLLCLQREPDAVSERPPLADALAALDRAQLVALVTDLAARHPNLADEIDLLAAARTAGATADDPAVPAPADLELLRRQIMADMRGAVQTGYDSWGEEAMYDSDLSVALEPTVTRADALLQAGDARAALDLLTAATEAWDAGSDQLDEYLIEYFDETGVEFLYDLAGCWAEAILSADLDEAARTEWAERLSEWADSIMGGAALQLAVLAAEQGWDDDAIVAAMAGRVDEPATWDDDDAEAWDDDDLASWEEDAYDVDLYDLVGIRLRILERQDEIDAYLNLAQATGQTTAYLCMLVEQGQAEQALAEGLAQLVLPRDVRVVADTLRRHEHVDEALTLAQHGLDLPAGRDKRELALWLRDAARDAGRTDLALEAGRRVVTAAPDLADYQALKEIAGEQWSSIQPDVLAAVRRHGGGAGAIDILLYEGLYAEAIAVVDSNPWTYDIGRVIEAVKAAYPDWAFGQCRRRADEIMDAGRAKDYDIAASWLARGKEILLAAANEDEWDAYLAEIMTEHARKYKLMPMLRALA